jgi:tetratricopeptide (TPR) repeat protein
VTSGEAASGSAGAPAHVDDDVDLAGAAVDLSVDQLPEPVSDAALGRLFRAGRAFGGLTDATRRVLSVAAVLGSRAGVTETAEVVACDTATVLDACDEGAAAGLVRLSPDGQVTFVDELVRGAVDDSLSAAERLDVHASAAALFAGEDGDRHSESPTRAVHHARRAAARSRADAIRAVAICEAAGRALVAFENPEAADDALTAAVELHAAARLGQPSAALTLDWAHVAARRGRVRVARDRYDDALARAQAEQQPQLVAEAALGWAGVWVGDYLTDTDRIRMLALYETALDGLRDDTHASDRLRSRLRSRLAAEAAVVGGPVEPVHAAVAAARQTGDPRCLADALALAHHALFTQETTRTRLALADELVEVTADTDLHVLALAGLLWRTVDLLHLGDARFVRSHEMLRERATVLGNEEMLYYVAVIDGQIDISQGRLADAEAALGRWAALGERIGRRDVIAYGAAQLATMRWMQGRDAEILGDVDHIAASPVLADNDYSAWAVAAALAARAGDHDWARSVLDNHVPRRLADLPPFATWNVALVALVEAAAALDDQDLAGQAYALIAPHADLPAVAGLGIVSVGSNERPLGVAACVLGQHDRAVAHLERAIAANHRLGHWPFLTLARAELAAALLRRDDRRAGDRERAIELLERAVADGTSFGLTHRVVGWQAQLADLRRGDRQAPSHPGDAGRRGDGRRDGVGDDARRGVIARDGRRWSVAVDDRRIRVANLVGMRYLADLLTNPRQRIPAVTLVDSDADPTPSDRHEVLDERARSEYAARALELSADIAEAEAAHDLHRAERLRIELDALVEQVEAATGLHGRPRHFADDHERARVAVQKAIKRAIEAVDDADPALADALRHTIATGVTCTYMPDPSAPIVWSTRAVDGAETPSTSPEA